MAFTDMVNKSKMDPVKAKNLGKALQTINLGLTQGQQNAAPPMQMQSIPSAPIQGIPADAMKALRQRQAQMMGNYQQAEPGYGYQQQPMQSIQRPMGLLRY
jgi:hypothetical protein